MKRPEPHEHSPYYENYIKLVDGNDPIKLMIDQLTRTQKLFTEISEDKGGYSFAEGKWTIKEVLGHIIDTERVFAYRALSIARGEKQSLPGFEQEDYARTANYNERNLTDIIEEYKLTREANIALFKSFEDKAINRRGIANNKEITVRAILFIIPGHEEHHINIIKSKYLN